MQDHSFIVIGATNIHPMGLKSDWKSMVWNKVCQELVGCIDNGPMENFWGILKAEKYYLKGKYETFEELETDIKNYITFYNNKRLQRLNSMSPLEYRAHAAKSILFIYIVHLTGGHFILLMKTFINYLVSKAMPKSIWPTMAMILYNLAIVTWNFLKICMF